VRGRRWQIKFKKQKPRHYLQKLSISFPGNVKSSAAFADAAAAAAAITRPLTQINIGKA